MRHNKRRARQPTEINRALALAIERQAGFDVVMGALDSSDPTIPLKYLKKECRKVSVRLGDSAFAPMLGTKLRLFQPSTEALRIVRDKLEPLYAFHLTYVEVAYDFIARNKKEAQRLGEWLLAHLNVLYSRQCVRRKKGTCTFYFQRRHDSSGSRSPRVVALYWDRKTKLSGPHRGRPCAHVEVRLSGATALARAGIFSVGDLIDFNHGGFWQKQVTLSRFKSKTQLGESLDPDAAQVSGTALRKRACTFLRAHCIDGKFVMHNAQRSNRSLGQVLESIDLTLFFSSAQERVEGND